MLCLLAVFSLLGTALLYAGWRQVSFGAPLLNKPPFLSGLGPTYTSWAYVPVLALVCGALLFLILRNCALHGEDPLGRYMLWPCLICQLLHVSNDNMLLRQLCFMHALCHAARSVEPCMPLDEQRDA